MTADNTPSSPKTEQMRLQEGYRRFRKGHYKEAAELYFSLGEGQEPSIMIIGCADSRADPALIFDAAPGEMFVVRNVAALVPPYDDSGGYHGVSAAVEFAVRHLKVKMILVLGHGGCGGVKASLAAAEQKPVGQFIAPWVEMTADARARVLADDSHDSPKERQLALELEVVRESMANLMTFPFVRDAVEKGQLDIDGAWFAIAKGNLYWLDKLEDAFQIVDPGLSES